MIDHNSRFQTQSYSLFGFPLERYLIVVLLVIAAGVFFTNLSAIDNFDYKIWGDREISRSAVLDQHFMVSGAELNGRQGTRVPGGAIHYITFALLQIDPSPKFVQWVLGVSILLSALFLGYVAWRVSDILGAIVTLTVFLTSSTTLTNLSILWNPTFGLPFTVFGFGLLVLYLIERRPLYLIICAIFFALSAQMQLAILAGALVVVLYFIIFRVAVEWKTAGWILLAVLILYSPWILNRTLGWFPTPDTLPTLDAVYISKAGLSFDLDFNIVQIVKKITLAVYRTILVGEPNVFPTALPITALILGIGALPFIKADATRQSDVATLNQWKVVVFLIFYMAMAAIIFNALIVSVGSVGFNKPRYFIFLTPAAALATGLGFSIFCQQALFKSAPAVTRLVMIFILAVVAIRALITVNFNLARADLPLGETPDFDDLVEISQLIHSKTGYGSASIARRTSYLLFHQGKWRGRISPMNYLLKYLNLQDANDAYGGCLFVVARHDMEANGLIFLENARTAVEELIQKNSAVQTDRAGGSASVETLAEHKNFYLFGVKAPLSGCPKSFMNPYIPTSPEIYLEKKFDGIASNVLSEDEKGRYLIRHAADNPKFPIFLLLDIEKQSSRSIVVTIHSRQLRMAEALLDGYFSTRTIHRPTLIFTNSETKASYRSVLFDGRLGEGVFSAPWSTRIERPPAGTYELVLKFEGPEAAAIPLTKQFVVR